MTQCRDPTQIYYGTSFHREPRFIPFPFPHISCFLTNSSVYSVRIHRIFSLKLIVVLISIVTLFILHETANRPSNSPCSADKIIVILTLKDIRKVVTVCINIFLHSSANPFPKRANLSQTGCYGHLLL